MLQSSTSGIAYVQTQCGEAPLGSVLFYHMNTFREVGMQTKERG